MDRDEKKERYRMVRAQITTVPPNGRMLNSSALEQLEKVVEEASEYRAACENLEPFKRQAEELIDLILTEIGLLSKYPERDVNAAFLAVMRKGKERGDW